ncbi:MAG TPA: DNA topoisomerase I [Candidatus Dormibacteraeota bacterium]|jgi:DNA topoisomerase-1|nr:DNA topoisomerase I [Candidatus Dormibacteraeota bacterium]
MKWKQLIHNGVAFPPLYEPKGLEIIINGGRIQLSLEAEELAYAWGKKRTTPYVQDSVFQTNFLSDFSKLLPSKFADVKYSEINFNPVYEYQQKEELRKADEELKKKLAAQRRDLRLQLKEKYGYATIDGTKTEFANYMVEPPSIFMGRGSHPMRGRWKPRIFPEDVVLNLSEDAPIPAPPVPGKWKDIAHDHESIWLAYWVDKLSQVRKYVWPSDVSDLRQERDKMKYENAKKLRRKLSDVRDFIEKNLDSPDLKARKLATVCYLIDNLAMRVGDEKEEDEADTVGASTLRVEHLRFLPKGVGFDFLGKDSVRWEKTLELDGNDSPIRRNLQEFASGKRHDDLVFDGVTSEGVNRFLNKAMRGLTAKVFRTHHATETVQTYLGKHNGFKSNDPAFIKLYHARMANLEAAIRCNHKRTPPKTWQNSLDKKQQRLVELKTKEPKTEIQKHRLEERRKKLELDVKLQQRTRDYNLNTSLRNYIDPRVYKSWANRAEFDWESIYPKTLQRKFLWATKSKA